MARFQDEKWKPAWSASSIANTQRRAPTRKVTRGLALTIFLVVLILLLKTTFFYTSIVEFNYIAVPIRPELYPVPPNKVLQLPRSRPKKIPKIQHAPILETAKAKEIRVARLNEVRDTFLHAWKGYKKEAWAKDELRPISGGFKTPFCGWAATLVDSLDTLWIMGLYEEFKLALAELPKVDFTYKEGCQINLFETTIRHLGGLLAAFDLSGGTRIILIEKAVELAEVLFTAFDTPNRMPTPHFTWSATNPEAYDHLPSRSVVVAVLGSLSLEFTRLAQITGNNKYFDGIQRVVNELEKWQNNTQLPGMWPAMVDSSKINQSMALGSPYAGADELFTIGALADSTYEYLPKQFLLLGGLSPQYRSMYESFITTARTHLFFRPMTIADHDILIPGTINILADGPPRLTPTLEHLSCFAGGMLALSSRIFSRPSDLSDAIRLTNGCIWAYTSTLSSIMPESLTLIPCTNLTTCPWDEARWLNAVDPISPPDLVRAKIKRESLPPGFAAVTDARYLLRPEAIESIFYLHRITADPVWAEKGWEMFKAIRAATTTALAHSAVDDVLSGAPTKVDEMESFWLGETLKYFFLLYSEHAVVDLDEWVLNTEAHPLRRPR